MTTKCTTTPDGFWAGASNAVLDDHITCYEFADQHAATLASYRFIVSDDLTEARVDMTNPNAANGNWTLAEIWATSPVGTRSKTIRAMIPMLVNAATQWESRNE